MLISWELSDKELDPLSETIRSALSDASLKAREIARIAYGNLFLLFPLRAERIRNSVSKPLQAKLMTLESELLSREQQDENEPALDQAPVQEPVTGEGEETGDYLRLQVDDAGSSSVEPSPIVASVVTTKSNAAAAAKGKDKEKLGSPVGPNPSHNAPTIVNRTLKMAIEKEKEEKEKEKEKEKAARLERTKAAEKEREREREKERQREREKEKEKEKERERERERIAATTSSLSKSNSCVSLTAELEHIQLVPHSSMREGGLVRGASSRRRSIVKNPFAELSDSYASLHGRKDNDADHSSRLHQSPKSHYGMSGMLSSNSSPTTKTSNASSPTYKKSPGRDSSIISHPQPFHHGLSSSSSTGQIARHSLTETYGPSMSQRERDREEERNRLRQKATLGVAKPLVPVSLEYQVSSMESATASAEESLEVGTRVLVAWGKDPVHEEVGTIRFLGSTLFAVGLWVGVELDQPLGKNNGSVQGQQYFTCSLNYGLFVRPEHVKLITGTNFEVDDSPLNFTAGSEKSNNVNGSTMSSINTSEEDDEKSLAGNNPIMSLNASATLPGPTGARKKASVLKIKLSQMMNLLNQQLEIVEELEKAERQAALLQDSSAQEMNRIHEHIEELKEEINVVTIQEVDVIENFRLRWKELS
jgi:hypothetical protein